MFDELRGRSVLITGAGTGIGAAVARGFGRFGAKVGVHYHRSAEAAGEVAAAVRDAGGAAALLQGDITEKADVARIIDAHRQEFGRLDVLINNAAITFVGDLQIPLKRHDLIMEVNLRAPLIATRQAVPHMLRAGGGAIVNVSSAASLVPFPGLMSYGISKAGLERMTTDVANQYADRGIQCNCFRIDIPVASEGFVANTPGQDRTGWEPCEVPAEGIVWVLRQPAGYSGQLLSMFELRRDQGIMKSRAAQPYTGNPPVRIVTGILQRSASMFVDA